MSNDEIASLFKSYADLSELHGGNPFKIKSFQSAAYRIERMPEPLASKTLEQLQQTEGIGKSIAEKIHEISNTGSFADLDELVANTPVGVVEMFKVKGIGPKKIAYIWNQLGIESVGELYYACKENRLAQAKGFGGKTQENIIDSIEFIFNNANKFHYARVEKFALKLAQDIKALFPDTQISLCGEIRRRCEVIEQIDLLIGTSVEKKQLEQLSYLNNIQAKESGYSAMAEQNLPIHFYTTSADEFAMQLLKFTGNDTHLEQLNIEGSQGHFKSEVEIYQSLSLPYIEPEMREGRGEVEKARNGNMPELIELTELKGILHNHTTYSDGSNSLTEMAEYAKALGYQYLGICDHSQSAQYAGGLKPEAIYKQQAEIDKLNKSLAPFKIFKGIESDILGDGSLDYSQEVLSTFDFIVASVHSNLKMNEEKAMMRLIKAIENPYTTILGHPTGRLLLMREGYPIDHAKIIDACAANGVCIEINANPYRLDIDWRWIDYAMHKNVMLSINPDAHETVGYHDMYFGVCVARKGGLTAEYCLNALSLDEIQKWFNNKKP
jgi:DNA polymerase (family 10)